MSNLKESLRRVARIDSPKAASNDGKGVVTGLKVDWDKGTFVLTGTLNQEATRSESGKSMTVFSKMGQYGGHKETIDGLPVVFRGILSVPVNPEDDSDD